MRIGFSGSRSGLSEAQRGVLTGLLRQYGPGDWFIHGGEKHADMEAHFLARNQLMRVRVWPSDLPGTQGDFPDAREIMPAMPPLKRNSYIVVDNLDHLYACPKDEVEVLRSGTWSVVRRCRRQLVDHSIILRDGHVDTVVYVKQINIVKSELGL
jgi:hypothetical protein